MSHIQIMEHLDAHDLHILHDSGNTDIEINKYRNSNLRHFITIGIGGTLAML